MRGGGGSNILITLSLSSLFIFFYDHFFQLSALTKLRRPARDPGCSCDTTPRQSVTSCARRRHGALINGPRSEAAGVPVPGQPAFVPKLEGSGEVVLAEN